MSKKAQVFQNVSAAINLDSRGDRENAFIRYLQCLQMSSTFLLEQYRKYNGLLGLDGTGDNLKNEMKQMLSVICDCADRAGSILIPEDLATDPPQLERINAAMNCQENVDLDPCNFAHSFNRCSNWGSADSNSVSCISSNTDSLESQRRTSNSSAFRNSPRALRRMNSNSRYPLFSKVDEENAALFRKYQMRINNAKDKYAKENLRLELQRRLAENLSIAKAKREEALRRRKEEKERALDEALRGMMSQSSQGINAIQQEKRELYLEVLYYEATESHFLEADDGNSDVLPPSEVIQKIFQRTLRCSKHPLFQWLTVIQMKLKKSLSVLLKEYTDHMSLLPGNCWSAGSNCTPSSMLRNTQSIEQKEKIEHLQKSLEATTQSIRESIDIIMEVTFVAYKSQLPDDADTAFYKSSECSLISPLWPLISTLFRISNISSEWKIVQTMQNCQSMSYSFGIASGRLNDHEDVYASSIEQLKKIPSLLSLVDKLTVLVNVCQKLSTCGSKQAVESSERLLGADELVPVLSYVLVRSALPQLVSECCALQSLVDAKYMLGEEGYALTSFLTALSYLEMKELINPGDFQNMNGASQESCEISDNSLSS